MSLCVVGESVVVIGPVLESNCEQRVGKDKQR